MYYLNGLLGAALVGGVVYFMVQRNPYTRSAILYCYNYYRHRATTARLAVLRRTGYKEHCVCCTPHTVQLPDPPT